MATKLLALIFIFAPLFPVLIFDVQGLIARPELGAITGMILGIAGFYLSYKYFILRDGLKNFLIFFSLHYALFFIFLFFPLEITQGEIGESTFHRYMIFTYQPSLIITSWLLLFSPLKNKFYSPSDQKIDLKISLGSIFKDLLNSFLPFIFIFSPLIYAFFFDLYSLGQGLNWANILLTCLGILSFYFSWSYFFLYRGFGNFFKFYLLNAIIVFLASFVTQLFTSLGHGLDLLINLLTYIYQPSLIFTSVLLTSFYGKRKQRESEQKKSTGEINETLE